MVSGVATSLTPALSHGEGMFYGSSRKMTETVISVVARFLRQHIAITWLSGRLIRKYGSG